MPSGTAAFFLFIIYLGFVPMHYHVYGQTVNVESISIDSTNTADSNKKSEKLKNFRKAFKKVINQKSKQQSQRAAKDPALDLGGFVLDETRSKMGHDFYALFYQKWEAPDKGGNFTLTVTEKPTFGRGSQVTIKLDYEKVFSARLQPRYEYINALSEQAVRRCRNIIKRQESVKQQLSGY